MNKLQQADGVVKSVLEVREIRSDLNDEDFALWYEEHFRITERRVLGILAAGKVEMSWKN